jgi:hypothetical protein
MKATWEQIVDYSRGIASDDVNRIVESDAVALREAQSLAVIVSAKEPVPEMWMNRAKALLVQASEPVSVLRGLLSFRSLGMQPGFRAAQSAIQAASVEFDDATLEVQIQAMPSGNELELVGVLETPNASTIRVGTPEAWLTVCDSEGQFIVTLPSTAQVLLLQSTETGKTYEVEIRYEN